MLLGDFTTGVSLLCPALQVCGHPRLVQEPEEDLAGNTSQLLQASGKLQVLHELLQRLKAQGRRVLVLSAMQKVRVLAAHMYNPLERHAGADHAVECSVPSPGLQFGACSGPAPPLGSCCTLGCAEHQNASGQTCPCLHSCCRHWTCCKATVRQSMAAQSVWTPLSQRQPGMWPCSALVNGTGAQ